MVRKSPDIKNIIIEIIKLSGNIFIYTCFDVKYKKQISSTILEDEISTSPQENQKKIQKSS